MTDVVPRHPDLTRACGVILAAVFALAGVRGAHAQSWNCLIPEMPTPHSLHVAVSAKDAAGVPRIYVLGGNETETANSRHVESYSPIAGQWQSHSPIPSGRAASSRAGATGANGRIYLFGGFTTQTLAQAHVDEYDPSTDTWTARSSIGFTARGGAAAAAGFNGTTQLIYVFGGSDAGPLSVVEAYDPQSDTWQPKAPMPAPSGPMLGAAQACNGRIYVFSFDGTGSVWEYDPIANNWQVMTSMPDPRFAGAAVTGRDGKIYIMGGKLASTSGYCPTTQVDVYDPMLEPGSPWTTIGATNCSARAALAAVALGDRVYSTGGETHGSCQGITGREVESFGALASLSDCESVVPRTAVEFILKCADGWPLMNAVVEVAYSTSDNSQHVVSGVTQGTATDYGPPGFVSIPLAGASGLPVGSWSITTPDCRSPITVSVATGSPFEAVCEDCGPVRPCTTAPAGMTGWFPLDEQSGPVVRDVIWGQMGAFIGTPMHVLGSRVNNSLFFPLGSFVSVADPNHRYDLTQGQDFSIDFWVRDMDDVQGVRTVLDRRALQPNGKPSGYHVFLYRDSPYPTPAKIGLQMADAGAGAGYDNFISPAALEPGGWHHVAITVDGDPVTGTGAMYVDGALVHNFDPRSRVLQLPTDARLYIGERLIDDTAPVVAALDEIELFTEALTPEQVQATMGELPSDSIGGKCKYDVVVPSVATLCGRGPKAISIMVCNNSSVVRYYQVALQPAAGLEVDYVGGNWFTVTALFPGQCETYVFDAALDAQAWIPAYPGKLTKTYSVTVSSGANPQLSEQPFNTDAAGAVQFLSRALCPGDIDIARSIEPPTNVISDSIVVTNDDDSVATSIVVSWEAFVDSSSGARRVWAPARHVRVNGALPGQPAGDSITVGPGQSAAIPVSIEFLAFNPHLPVTVIMRVADQHGAGFMQAEQSILIVQRPGAVTNAATRPSARTALRLSAGPNPSAGTFDLHFSLARPGPVWLEVFDISGRLVRRLIDGSILTGEQSPKWDGRDQFGHPVQAGLYFARMRAMGEVVSTRLVTLR